MPEERLLIVDDEPELAEFVGIVGTSLGYDVMVTGSASAFKQAFESFDPTKIVMDILMPETNGVELVRWLVGRGCTARVLVVSGMISVYGKSIAELASEGELSISFLTKPYRLELLREALQQLD